MRNKNTLIALLLTIIAAMATTAMALADDPATPTAPATSSSTSEPEILPPDMANHETVTGFDSESSAVTYGTDDNGKPMTFSAACDSAIRDGSAPYDDGYSSFCFRAGMVNTAQGPEDPFSRNSLEHSCRLIIQDCSDLRAAFNQLEQTPELSDGILPNSSIDQLPWASFYSAVSSGLWVMDTSYYDTAGQGGISLTQLVQVSQSVCGVAQAAIDSGCAAVTGLTDIPKNLAIQQSEADALQKKAKKSTAQKQ